jgi:cytochrome P450
MQPVNLSFTNFGKGLLARERILVRLTAWIEDRRKDNSSEYKDLLQTLIESVDPDSGQRADTETIAKNCIVILLAAIDTTTSVVASVLKLLNTETDCRKKVIEECRQVWGASTQISKLSTEEINRCMGSTPYLEAVIQETMRVRTPILSVLRYTNKDTTLPGTDYKIPKGWFVSIASYGTFNGDEEAFADPGKFMPERFLPGGVSVNCAGYKNSHFPFGKGTHLCPGNKFALAESKIILSILALRSHWPELIGTYKDHDTQVPALEQAGGLTFKF